MQRVRTQTAGTSILPGMIVIKAATLLALEKQHKSVPIHQQVRTYIMQTVHSAPLQVYKDNVHQIPTAEFADILDRYWTPFSQDCMDAIWIIGVIPMTLLVLSDGQIVPKVLKIGTYDLGIYYDFKSEQLCFAVMRVNVENNHKQAFGVMSGNALFNDNLSNDDRSFGITGPTAIDPRENQTTRLDLGYTKFAHQGFDLKCIVLSGFGFDPQRDGRLTSIVSSLYEEYQMMKNVKSLYIMQEQRATVQRPFVTQETLSAEYIRSSSTRIDGPMDANDSTNAVDGRVVQLGYQEVLDNVTRQKTNEIQSQWLRAMETNQSSIRNPQMAGFDGMSEVANDSFVDNLEARRIEQQFFNTAPSGCSLTNVQPLVSGKFLEYICEHFEQSVTSTYGMVVALVRNVSSTQGSVDLQSQRIGRTIHWWHNILTTVNTRIYDIIYAGVESDWELTQLMERSLHTSAVFELIADIEHEEFERSLTAIKRVQSIDAERNGRLGLGNVKTPYYKETLSFYDSDSDWDIFSDSDFDDDDDFFWLFLLIEAETNISRRSRLMRILKERDANTANEQVKEMFKNAVMDASYGEIFQLFVKGSEGQKAWYTENRRMIEDFKNRSSPLNGIDERLNADGNGSGFKVTFTTNNNASVEQLINLQALGYITRHEASTAIRSSLFYPVPSDIPSKEDLVDKYKEILGSKELERMMQSTQAGTLISASKDGIQESQNRAVEEAVAKEHAKNEIALEKLRLQLKNAGQTVSSSSETSTSSSSSSASSEKKTKEPKKPTKRSAESQGGKAKKQKSAESEDKPKNKVASPDEVNADKAEKKKNKDQEKKKSTAKEKR